MKRKVLGFVVAFVVLAVLAVIVTELRNVITENKKDATLVDAEKETYDDIEGYSYNEVEKIISYLADSEETEKALARLADPLTKSECINVQYIRSVFDIVDIPAAFYANVLVGMQEADKVSREQFDTIYCNIVDAEIIDGLSRRDIYVFDTYVDDEGNTYVYDGKETYELDIEHDDSYMDHIADVYIKDNKIFKLNGYGDTKVTLDGVFILSVSDEECTFLYDGITKTYHCSKLPDSTDCVAFVTIGNLGLEDIYIPQDIRKVRIEKVTDDGFVLDDYSVVARSDEFEIYNIYDEAFCEKSLQLLTGYKQLSLVCEDNKAVAAVIDEELVSDDIRVILSNDDYTSYDMKYAEITGEGSYKVVYPDESEVVYNEGDTVCIKADEYKSGDVIVFSTTEKNGAFSIDSLSRSYGVPSYKGSIELKICDNEVLHIINKLKLEDYLYSVVSSEMPASSHPEALKAMAICARGYAYSSIEDDAFEEYGADLDDSSLCQVYNYVEETDESINAVKDTYGIVPTYDGNVIFPFYFSTSFGMTCTNSDIWGGSNYPYLETNVETIDKEKINLSDEETFKSFILGVVEYDVIDKDMPYYRWDICYTSEEVSQAINSMLEERVRMSSDNIKVKNDNGQYVSGDISDIGTVVNIAVTKRTESGVVETLEIEGTRASIQVTGQTNIRNLITPVNQEIIRQDGTTASGWTSLPSPFYYVDKTEDGFVIHGGGFGHGVGMSQNGANILAGEGYNYRYILRHYYSYIDLTQIYDASEGEE